MTSVQLSPVRAWNNPAAVAPRGTLVVIPGRGEHPGVYERFGSRLSFDAYRVRAVSDPSIDPVAVRQQIADVLADPALPAPHVLVGSDTGALFAIGIVARREVQVDAMVLAGLPARAEGASLVGDWDGELAARTSCPTHRGRLDADPEVRRGTLNEQVDHDWLADADLSEIGVPVLGLHGTEDSVSPLPDVRPLYAAADDASLVSISGGRHDALNDATHRTVAATVVLFLEQLRVGRSAPDIAQQEI